MSVNSEQALEELAWTIEASQGQFALILARCNYAQLQRQLAQRLQAICAVPIRMLVLQQSTKTLYARIREELEQGQPEALMVFGLEAIVELDQMLSAVNAVREEFRKNFQFPLVLWVTDDTLKKLVRLAPDLESWATTTEFAIAPDTLLQLLRQTIETLFTTLLTPNSPLSFNQLLRTLPPTVLTRPELEAALSELQRQQQAVDPMLQADLNFFCGLDFFRRLKKFEQSDHLEWFQRSLAIWQAEDGSALGLHNQLKQAVVLFYLGRSLYYAIERERQRAGEWHTAREPLQQCVALFEQANRPDLVAKSITQLERVLDRSQDWAALEATVQKSLPLQHAYGNLSRVAQDYRYLALAAVKQERWAEAEQVAEQALEAILRVPEDQHYEGLYRLTLASAQRRLGKLEAAMAQLTQARSLGDQGHPRIYVSILEELQQIYRLQRRYLEAFHLKQARLSTEQQYGIRAFVGAGRLRPQREDAELLEVPDLIAEQTEEEIAPEIWASGRQRDLEALLLRIGRNDYKLIVVHGPSGVGKSSLVSAGLVPGLKRRAIGTRRNLPVLVRQYRNWAATLEEALMTALAELYPDIERSPHTYWSESVGRILQQLQQSESRNLRVVLVFDQFEEFFFVHPDPMYRRLFYEFLGNCLTILNVKVVLSLREDYIHYLLECGRATKVAALGIDLLSQNVLYGLGNFSPHDARAIIESLTQRSQFYLEPALIDHLVQDLAGELGEVRPIELQVVGAQLQTEGITTLAQYQALGATPKQDLVQRYLEEVVGDCGRENQQIAELVLYLLTDERGTRPLKTRAELEQELRSWTPDAAEVASQLDLVLAIVVRSGLVMLLPEVPEDRYQLVHDYIAAFIREQQEPRLSELLAELRQEKELRSLKEQELRLALQRLEKSLDYEKQSRRRAEVAEIEALSLSSQALFLSNDQIGALMAGVKAGRQLQMTDASRAVQQRTVARLRQAIYGIRELNRLQGHSDWVQCIQFNPDGQLLASGSRDGTVRLWSTNGQQLLTLTGHRDWVNSVSFSPNGQLFASGGGDDLIKLWGLDGQELLTLAGHRGGVKTICFSPDGQSLASGSRDGTVKLWSLNGQELTTLVGHRAEVQCVSFSPNGQSLASGSRDGTVKLWSLNGQELTTLVGHRNWVNSVSFSPDGQLLASGGDDDMVKLWNLDGQERLTFSGHRDRVVSVSFSPDGRKLASGSGDGTVKLWSLNGQELATLSGHNEWVNSVSFSPDGQILASGSGDHTIKLWSLQSSEVRIFSGSGDRIIGVGFRPDGQTLVTSSSNGAIRLWTLDGQELSFWDLTPPIASVSFSPDGCVLAFGDHEGTVQIWNLANQQRQILSCHDGRSRVRSIDFSPDGQMIAAGSGRIIKLWSRDGNELQTFSSSTSVRSLCFSPDGQVLAVGSRNGTVMLLSLEGHKLQSMSNCGNWINSLSYSPNGQILAVGGDKAVKLLHLATGTSQTLLDYAAGINSVSFSPNGQLLATGSGDRTVKLWSLDGRELQTFSSHSAGVASVSFSPDGQLLASSSCDGTVILRKLELLTSDLDELLIQGCKWLRNYLSTNRYLDDTDRQLCDGMAFQKKESNT